MTSPLNSQRPDDVSPEEEKRLLDLLSLCLPASREEKDANDLAARFFLELGKTQFDEESRTLLGEIFNKANSGDFSDDDCLKFVATLQKVSQDELNADERNSLRRLEFMLLTAVGNTEKRRSDSIQSLETLIRDAKERYRDEDSYADEATKTARQAKEDVFIYFAGHGPAPYATRETKEEAEDIAREPARLTRDKSDSLRVPRGLITGVSHYCLDVAHLGPIHEENDSVIAQFKAKVLWDILGNERPQNVVEFMRVLHEKGIVLRHSS